MKHNLNTRSMKRPITLRNLTTGDIVKCESVASAARLLNACAKQVRVSAITGKLSVHNHMASYTDEAKP